MSRIKVYILPALFLLCINSLFAQFHISGIVYDKQSGERLIGANVFEPKTFNGTSTDNSGYFSLIAKTQNISISYIGYKQKNISITSDTLLTIMLETGNKIDEITIVNKTTKAFNISTLSNFEMQNIPTIGGKPDIIKALHTMPGIESQNEGSSLMNVRGGSPGENLFLIDNVPLIYVNHLGGFMSVFNPDMINNIEVYKGGFPSRYGGKLSSIVNITQREGNRSKTKGSLSLGLTDASFSIEGPLLNKKASFIITGRKTLTELVFLLLAELSNQDFNTYYGFHDINGKFSWHPNPKNHIYLNFYQGDDYIRSWNKDDKATVEKNGSLYKWGNWMASARWNSMLSPRMLVDNTFSYTRYRLRNNIFCSYANDSLGLSFSNNYISSVSDVSLRSDWKYKMAQNWSLDFGTKASRYEFIPSKTVLSQYNTPINYETIRPIQIDGYCSNNFSILNRLHANIGLRVLNYSLQSYSDWSLEPRVDLNFNVTHKHTLNFTYQKTKQYSHMLITSGDIFNNEAWVPANSKIDPSRSNQLSVGWKGELPYNFDFETNLYYKQLFDLANYKEGYSNLLGDALWRTKIETHGTGTSKGLEVLLKKTNGKWTGHVAYTLSETTRQFENINFGKKYTYEYDRPHSLAINIHRIINKKWDMNLSWIYQTGLPYTPILGRQIAVVSDNNISHTEVLIYGERNSARMKNYHRLDAGFSYTKHTKNGNRAVWSFSIYNVYNRHNAVHYFYAYSSKKIVHYDPENYIPLKLYQKSYFPIIPSISYKIYFGDKNTIPQKTQN